jgi:hypothetical protein
VNTDPKHDPFIVASIEICAGYRPLELDCRVHRVHDASELNQSAVAN